MHYIDEKVDGGEIISVIPTDIYRTDTLDSVARRHYENEIEAISNFENYLDHPINDYTNLQEGKQHMRMSIEREAEMVRSFNEYIQAFT